MIRVGQKLREERLAKKLTIADVSAATKIKESFLSAIERGEYHKLPSTAYAHGFVSNYADFLGLSKRETMALFRREYAEEKPGNVLPDAMVREDAPLKGVRFQRRYLVLFALAVLIVGFLLFQFRYIFLNPSLTITQPKEVIQRGRSITVVGKTDSNVVLTVNDEEVALDKDGSFTKKITTFPGENTIIIRAKNRFGRETIVERTVTIQ